MKGSTEFNAFNSAMRQILGADPKAVKEAMERERQENDAMRKAKGERKRGRKPKTRKATSAASRASSAKG
jgi:hypothetical protein